jgi:hypothetical protein
MTEGAVWAETIERAEGTMNDLALARDVKQVRTQRVG